ncbi:MAG TPA: DUF503 domain-containing protein [Polyangiaceae bacterium]|jgi:hypothetical protein|nr:DUF503 domain-containing protein [Polyangiaceae bacterium]
MDDIVRVAFWRQTFGRRCATVDLVFVGVSRLVLQIPGARSLKDRRQVIKSFKERVKARMGISIAEVGDVEKLQVATLGLAVVSGESARCHELIDAVRAQAATLPEAILADVRSEVFSFSAGGSALGSDLSSAVRSRKKPAGDPGDRDG